MYRLLQNINEPCSEVQSQKFLGWYIVFAPKVVETVKPNALTPALDLWDMLWLYPFEIKYLRTYVYTLNIPHFS